MPGVRRRFIGRDSFVALALLAFAGFRGLARAEDDPRPVPAKQAACRLPDLAASSTDAELLSAYTLASSQFQSLEASAMVRATAGAEYKAKSGNARPSPAVIRFRAPSMLRLTGVIPLSARRTFDMSSDGHELRLLVPDGKAMRLFVGAADAPASSANPRENLRPQPLIDALHWPHGKLSAVSGREPAREGLRAIELELDPRVRKEARSAVAEFDLTRAVVDRLTIRDASNQAITEVDYSDWQAVPRGPESACLPRRIHLSQPQQHLEMDLKIMSISLNPPILPAMFRLAPPRGAQISRLGTEAPRKTP